MRQISCDAYYPIGEVVAISLADRFDKDKIIKEGGKITKIKIGDGLVLKL